MQHSVFARSRVLRCLLGIGVATAISWLLCATKAIVAAPIQSQEAKLMIETDRELAELTKNGEWHIGVTHLSLGEGITDAGLALLKEETKALEQLESLDMIGIKASDDGLSDLLSQASVFANLRRLDVSLTEFGFRSVDSLVRNLRHLRQLEVLSMSDSRLNDGGLKTLAKQLFHVRKLKQLDVGGVLSQEPLGDDGISDVTGRPKPATSGRLKTGHF